MKIALAQINTTVGDLQGNGEKILDWIEKARKEGCSLVVFPELTLSGYPPADLLKRKFFIENQFPWISKIAQNCQDIAAIVGYAEKNPSAQGNRLTNTAALIHQGKISSKHTKVLLPGYDVFDERRYFEPGGKVVLGQLNGQRFAINICEDIWMEEGFEESQYYHRHPVKEAMALGAQWIVTLSASPFHLGKAAQRIKLLDSIAKRSQCPIFYLNLVGGNDSLLFDGGSMALDGNGKICAQSPQFKEDLLVVEMEIPKDSAKKRLLRGGLNPHPQELLEQGVQALVMGLRDYGQKCGFDRAVLGLSGGLDSALTAFLAVEAFGAKNVWAIAMPSPFSSKESLADATHLAKNLGITLDTLPISETFAAFLKSLGPILNETKADVTEENLQARIRGTLLMALSNKFGHLLLSTGNKSELAVGYCTLYGDMNGGLSVLGDVPKTLVYELSHHINQSRGSPIPQNILDKPPSAELKPNQKDEDTLPAYEVLDAILRQYIEKDLAPEEIFTHLKTLPATAQITQELIQKITRMVDQAEYKRRQAAPTLRITTKAFGVGRRLPIAQRLRY